MGETSFLSYFMELGCSVFRHFKHQPCSIRDISNAHFLILFIELGHIHSVFLISLKIYHVFK